MEGQNIFSMHVYRIYVYGYIHNVILHVYSAPHVIDFDCIDHVHVCTVKLQLPTLAKQLYT